MRPGAVEELPGDGINCGSKLHDVFLSDPEKHIACTLTWLRMEHIWKVLRNEL